MAVILQMMVMFGIFVPYVKVCRDVRPRHCIVHIFPATYITDTVLPPNYLSIYLS
jgi:hypothetical protein